MPVTGSLKVGRRVDGTASFSHVTSGNAAAIPEKTRMAMVTP